MIKNRIIIFFVIIFIVVFLVIIFYNGQVSGSHIKDEIEKANYCKIKDDCVLAGSKCPFGCHIFVNKNEEEKISGLIDNYQTTCMYACVELKDYGCVNNKCEAFY